jgi:hypothetical protein
MLFDALDAHFNAVRSGVSLLVTFTVPDRRSCAGQNLIGFSLNGPSCEECRRLQARVAEVEALICDLQARLQQDSTNSSLPTLAIPPRP